MEESCLFVTILRARRPFDTYSVLRCKLRFYVSWNLAAHNTGANTISEKHYQVRAVRLSAMCLALSKLLGFAVYI